MSAVRKMSVEEEIKTTADQLIRALNVKNVMGDPIQMGDRLVLLVTKLGVGFGAALGEGRERGGRGTASGGGAGVQPMAAIVISPSLAGPDGVKVIPFETPNPLAKAIADTVDTVIETLRERKDIKKLAEVSVSK